MKVVIIEYEKLKYYWFMLVKLRENKITYNLGNLSNLK